MIEIEPAEIPGSLKEPEAFLDALTEPEAQALQALARRHRLLKGSIIFHEGFEADSAIVVLKGRVKLSSFSIDGRESLIGIRGPSDLLGAEAVLAGRSHSHTAVALEDVDLWIVPGWRLDDYLEEHHRVSRVLTRTVSAHMLEAESRVKEFGAYDSANRVVRRLIELSDRYGEGEDGCRRIMLPLSQEEVGSLVGCSREAVSKAFRALRTRGWIATGRRSISLLNLPGLRQRAGSA